ncbi:MAG: PRC-barrel domain-containing protein [Alphaproteobacteria bacterium]|nr:PRC-barrel domain-containing protein [Alphaproteobacteria bacterium]
MPTPSGHTRAILTSKITGTSVYNAAGDKLGHVEDVVLDKLSNNIMFAVLSFGGFLGMGEKFHALPWSTLDYSDDKDGYVVPYDKETLKAAPVYDKDQLTQDDGSVRAAAFDYYKAEPYWQ